MTVYTSLSAISAARAPSVVTIGKFDGVHTGHRAILTAAVAEAEQRSLRSVAVTFDRNPLALLRPEKCPPNLVALDRKIELLAESGVDDVLVVTFDEAFAHLPARDFVQSALVEALDARVVLVGADFRFGAGGRGTADTLRDLGAELGFGVVVVPDILGDDDRRVSSSAVRELLAQGDIRGATTMLGRAPSVRGHVVHGLKRGRELGYPTANLETPPTGFVPAEGVYAGYLIDHDAVGTSRHPAAISIGINPTFDDVHERQVEAYVLDADLDLYGHLVDIEFIEHVRGMVAFEGVPALIDQMGRDVDEIRDLLN
ncbi:bifunctional riboflavin kinase/FAD synthetase [Amnibacterium flavum]|uniref:Riboflavin biosynthesis protein n=1 Tax=Amnibacterium flavum TaxID=2173173 RepID=A0A2V1HMI7_9MICO|nr:bifunctional riboflavin kinase/FAD synthetase [Amnibacterium flavum]PVZ93631.1 bifunctional riboflavin kinase/FAD synthetase [Amnibacterium flavum]